MQNTQISSENLRPLDRLVGAWKGTGSFQMGGQSGILDVAWTFSPCAGGYGVEAQLTVLGIPGMARCEQKDLLAYDKAEKKVRWISICNTEDFRDRRGSIDGGALVVSDAVERLSVRFVGDRELAVDIAADGYSVKASLTLAGGSR